jgi:hypothetical protein
MKKIFNCRRSVVSLVGITSLLVLGLNNSFDVSLAITGCVAAICGANAFEATKRPKDEQV